MTRPIDIIILFLSVVVIATFVAGIAIVFQNAPGTALLLVATALGAITLELINHA